MKQLIRWKKWLIIINHSSVKVFIFRNHDKSFRNIAGLYNTEINLMRRYGSVGTTDMNPTGDPRKDDAGFNIVSFAVIIIK